MLMDHTINEPLVIRDLFQKDNSLFVVPVYQRPYAWDEEQCADLWYDLTEFAFPSSTDINFDEKSKYSLGDAYTYFNDAGQDELVDGQQRITTLLLLMRAFFEDLKHTDMGTTLAKSIWFTNEDESVDYKRTRIASRVLVDKDKERLDQILQLGYTDKKDFSQYSKNYRFFRQKIAEFKENQPANLETLAARILKNVYVLRRRSDSEILAQDLFMRINARGKSLTLDDIFKATLYKEAFKKGGEVETVVFDNRWGKLYDKCTSLFQPDKYLPEIAFAFWLITHKDKFIKLSHQVARYYMHNGAIRLINEQTLKDVESLLDFFCSLYNGDGSFNYPDNIKRKAFIIYRLSKNWTFHVLAEFYFKNRGADGNVDIGKFDAFLDRYIAYDLIGGITKNKFTLTRFHNIEAYLNYILFGDIEKKPTATKNEIKELFSTLPDLPQTQRKFIRETVLTWWTFKDERQPLINMKTTLDIEHIFPSSRAQSLTREAFADLIGNCAWIEKSLNSKAQNYSFNEKCAVYLNGVRKGKQTEGTFNEELKRLAKTKDDFTEVDIFERNKQIFDAVIDFLDSQGLLRR